ncbi:hypothetical protein EMIT0P228_10105 [Pseudomonas brassicacearum]
MRPSSGTSSRPLKSRPLRAALNVLWTDAGKNCSYTYYINGRQPYQKSLTWSPEVSDLEENHVFI